MVINQINSVNGDKNENQGASVTRELQKISDIRKQDGVKDAAKKALKKMDRLTDQQKASETVAKNKTAQAKAAMRNTQIIQARKVTHLLKEIQQATVKHDAGKASAMKNLLQKIIKNSTQTKAAELKSLLSKMDASSKQMTSMMKTSQVKAMIQRIIAGKQNERSAEIKTLINKTLPKLVAEKSEQAQTLVQKIADSNSANKAVEIKSMLQKIGATSDLEKLADLELFFENMSQAKLQDTKAMQQNQQAAFQTARTVDNGTKVLARLADGLSELGMDFNKMSEKVNANREIDNIIANKTEAHTDVYNVRNTESRYAVHDARNEASKKKQEKVEGGKGKFADNTRVKGIAQDYANVFAGQVVALSSDAKVELDKLRGKLKDEGFSDRDVKSLEKGVQRSLKKEVSSEIKDAFFETLLSPRKSFEFIVSQKKFKGALNFAVEKAEAMGIDKEDGVEELVDNVIDDSQSEIKDFIADQLEQTFMEKNISHKNVREDVTKLVTLGTKVGFNPDAFMNMWTQKKVDLGLVAPELFAVKKTGSKKISIGGVSTGGVSDRKGYNMTKEEETDLLMNRLRALAMKKALYGNLFTDISLRVEIKKTKNGLIKLNLTYEDLQTIEKQGIALARFRMLQQLKTAFMERSTFYRLSGGAYALVNKKVKGLIANLDKLGYNLSDYELDLLRDDANRQMYEHTIIELEAAIALSEKDNNPEHKAKIPLMVTLLNRIKEESGFKDELGVRIEDLMYRSANGLNGVTEAA